MSTRCQIEGFSNQIKIERMVSNYYTVVVIKKINRMGTHMNTCTHTWMHMCTHTWMHTCTHTWMHTHMNAHIHIRTCILTFWTKAMLQETGCTVGPVGTVGTVNTVSTVRVHIIPHCVTSC